MCCKITGLGTTEHRTGIENMPLEYLKDADKEYTRQKMQFSK
jgi:hypothetical protein